MKTILLAPLPPPSGGIAGWTKRMISLSGCYKDREFLVVDEKIIQKNRVKDLNKKPGIFSEIQRTFLIWKNLNNLLKKEKDARVVHSCIPAYFTSMLREYICSKITKKHKGKFIVHFRCTVPNTIKRKRDLLLLKKFLKSCDAVIVLNRVSYDFIKNLGYTKELTIIPNFVQENEIFGMIKKFDGPVKQIVYTGRLFEDKGCLEVISVARHMPNITFKLIGKNCLGDVEIPNNVILTGELSKTEVSKELINSDCFIFLSYFLGEGFSNSLLEAMSSGLPCIVSDWAANKDMIENAGGFVVDKNDITQICEKIKLLDEPTYRSKLGNENIKKVRDEYSERVVLNKYIELYERLENK